MISEQMVMGLISIDESRGLIIEVEAELTHFLGYEEGGLNELPLGQVLGFSEQSGQGLNGFSGKTKQKAFLITKDGTKVQCFVKSYKSPESQGYQCVVFHESREVVSPGFEWLWELPDSIFIHNFKVITYVNRAFLKLFGYADAAEILGQKIPDALVHPDDFELVMEGRQKALSQDVFRIPCFRGIKKDGTTFLTESQLSSIIVNGEPHLQVVSRDITERKAREERTYEVNLLMEESQKLAQLGSWQWNIQDNLVTWSKELFRIYGLKESEFEASFEAYLSLVHPEDRDHVKEVIQNALVSGVAVHFEERIIRPDGEVRYLKSWGQVRANADGGGMKMFGACMDITERKMSEMESLEKEYQLERFADSVNSAIIVVNQDQQIKYWNEHATKLFGYDKKEVVDMDLSDLMPEHLRASHIKGFNAFLEKGELKSRGTNLELEGLRKNGKVFPLQLTLTSWKQGSATFVCAVVTDITDRKQAQARLETSERRYKDLFENSLDGIYKSTSDGKFVEVNPALVNMLGYESAEELLSIDIKSELYFAEEERQSAQNDDIDVYRLRKKNGEEIWVEDHGRYEPNESGQIVFHAGVLRDITARKNAEEKLINSLQVTMEQNKRLLDFSYIVSHNLRSHTSNISGVLSLLEMAETEEEKKDLMEMLRKVADALDDTMHHLNNVVNIQTTTDLPLQKLCLYDYVNRTKEILVEQINARNALIVNEVNPDIYVTFNVAYLESILLNFMSNGVKYASPERRLRLTISCKELDKFYELSIKDNGLGIDMDRHGDSLFGMYKTFHKNHDARGIGLFISKNQIESMGGSVRAESEVDKGSTFYIKIAKREE